MPSANAFVPARRCSRTRKNRPRRPLRDSSRLPLSVACPQAVVFCRVDRGRSSAAFQLETYLIALRRSHRKSHGCRGCRAIFSHLVGSLLFALPSGGRLGSHRGVARSPGGGAGGRDGPSLGAFASCSSDDPRPRSHHAALLGPSPSSP